MSKRLGLNLSDDTHAQIKQRADVAGVSVHSWIVAAIERERITTSSPASSRPGSRQRHASMSEGVSREADLNRLIDEHKMRQVHAAYARLRNDPEQWAGY
jgi:hypothetical protein